MTAKGTIKRFERVREARERLCDEIRLEMADVRERERRLVIRSENLDMARASAVKTFSDFCRAGVMAAAEVWSLRTRIDSVEEDLLDVRGGLDDARRELERLRGILEERHRDAKAVENLVDSMKEAYRKECLCAEQVEMDDLASMKFFRNNARVR